jgi:hypothetical protein
MRDVRGPFRIGSGQSWAKRGRPMNTRTGGAEAMNTMTKIKIWLLERLTRSMGATVLVETKAITPSLTGCTIVGEGVPVPTTANAMLRVGAGERFIQIDNTGRVTIHGGDLDEEAASAIADGLTLALSQNPAFQQIRASPVWPTLH